MGTGTSGRRSRGRVSLPVAMLCTTSNWFSPAWARVPVSISYRISPSANWSLRPSTFLRPLACSGDMYAAVPTTDEVAVSVLPSLPASSFETPKSRTLGTDSPQGPRAMKMLAGLRSR